MSLDIHRFVRDFNLTTADSGEKHYRNGWVNLACPFCFGSEGYHLGYNEETGHWNCYRCGYHNEVSAVKELTKVNWEEAKRIVIKYGGRPILKVIEEDQSRPAHIVLPQGTGPLNRQAKRYLKARNFDPYLLEEEWGLMSTGPVGNYKFRIIAPIFFRQKIVSYQGRDYTEASPYKYKACPKDEEVVFHKQILYGADYATEHSVIVVEGITDVWRLGRGAVATLGIEWTYEQVSLLRHYPRVLIMFDQAEYEARRQAFKLGQAIAAFGSHVEVYTDRENQKDPADMTDKEARAFMRQFFNL